MKTDPLFNGKLTVKYFIEKVQKKQFTNMLFDMNAELKYCNSGRDLVKYFEKRFCVDLMQYWKPAMEAHEAQVAEAKEATAKAEELVPKKGKK